MQEPLFDSSPPAGVVTFGTFRLDLGTGELWRAGRPVPLSDKPFQVLSALLEADGGVVSRDELCRRLWPENTFVDFDNNLNAAVNKLREALDDRAANPRFVETLPRRGYRFVAPLAAEASAEPLDPPAKRRDRKMIGAVAASLGLALLVAWGLSDRSAPTEPRVEATAQPPTAAGRILLAVLPLDDLSTEGGQRFFADGLTEELISRLSRLDPDRLGVIARISSMTYRDTSKTVAEIGRELGVDYLIEGSVRREGDRMRFTAQLIRAADQTHLWAQSYDRPLEDVLAIQADLARRVAQSLTLHLLPSDVDILARAGTVEPRAYEAYLRGRDEWNRYSSDGFEAAIGHFERALAIDPDYAIAWSALADSASLLGYDRPRSEADRLYARAESAAERALALEPRLAEAYNSLGFVATYRDFDFERAVTLFERGFEIHPGYAMACHWSAAPYSALHRHDEALAAVWRAQGLDPRSQSVGSDVGWYLLFADRFEEGVEECRRTLELGTYGWAESCVEVGLVRQARWEEAVDFLTRQGQAPAAGESAEERWKARMVGKIDAELARERPSASGLAMMNALAGRREAALNWLERSAARRDGWLVFLRVDPRFDSLHGDPRFEAVATDLGLPVVPAKKSGVR